MEQVVAYYADEGCASCGLCDPPVLIDSDTFPGSPFPNPKGPSTVVMILMLHSLG
jgi:hypothetical protein